MSFIEETGRAAVEPAKTRGAFPLFESTLKDDEPIRNATVTTIAPTGTLSIIASCSSGVEPVFAFVYVRNVMDGTQMVEVNPMLMQKLHALGQRITKTCPGALPPKARFPAARPGGLRPGPTGQRGEVAVHAEDAVGDDELARGQVDAARRALRAARSQWG